ncbi:MAG TPA: DUF2846 domain-containing protein [Candidatus Acidoferrales bacterium]
MILKRAVGVALAWLLVLGLLVPSAAVLAAGPAQQKEQDEDEPKTEADKAKQKELEAKACGPENVKHSARTDKKQHPTPEPPADKALIYVLRPTMSGNKVQTKLGVDGKWMGVNRGDNYFFFTLEPGEHYFCSLAENKSVLALKVEAGKTYYLQQKIRFGWMKARNQLVLLDEAEGKAGLAKCHLALFEEKN